MTAIMKNTLTQQIRERQKLFSLLGLFFMNAGIESGGSSLNVCLIKVEDIFLH